MIQTRITVFPYLTARLSATRSNTTFMAVIKYPASHFYCIQLSSFIITFIALKYTNSFTLKTVLRKASTILLNFQGFTGDQKGICSLIQSAVLQRHFTLEKASRTEKALRTISNLLSTEGKNLRKSSQLEITD